MQRVVVEGVDPVSIEHAVGNASYVKGARYAQQHAVVHMEWDDAESALLGTVRGSGGRLYTTVVYFVSGNCSDLVFEFAECSCPVGFDCKHAAALALMAAPAASPRTGAGGSRPAVMWERSLGSLLEPDRADESPSGGTALAIELTLSGAPGSASNRAPVPGVGPKLLARLVRPGKTGWVGGGLSWGRLGSLHYYGEYRASQVRLLQELYTLYQSRTNPATYYSYRDDKTIDLAAFGQPAALVVSGRGRGDRRADGAREQAARCGREVQPRGAVPRLHGRTARGLARHRTGAAHRRAGRRRAGRRR